MTPENYNLAGIYTYGALLEHLQAGMKFASVTTYRDGTKQLDTVLSADNRLIRWHHYGSSANHATPDQLKFVIEQLFKMTLPEFLRAYVWVW